MYTNIRPARETGRSPTVLRSKRNEKIRTIVTGAFYVDRLVRERARFELLKYIGVLYGVSAIFTESVNKRCLYSKYRTDVVFKIRSTPGMGCVKSALSSCLLLFIIIKINVFPWKLFTVFMRTIFCNPPSLT